MSQTVTLGQRIQSYRKSAGLSQEALGEQLQVSRQAVSKWESDTTVPELESLISMSRMFQVQKLVPESLVDTYLLLSLD